jgi:hypothetical protein
VSPTGSWTTGRISSAHRPVRGDEGSIDGGDRCPLDDLTYRTRASLGTHWRNAQALDDHCQGSETQARGNTDDCREQCACGSGGLLGSYDVLAGDQPDDGCREDSSECQVAGGYWAVASAFVVIRPAGETDSRRHLRRPIDAEIIDQGPAQLRLRRTLERRRTLGPDDHNGC